jgi:hypothetical protein
LRDVRSYSANQIHLYLLLAVVVSRVLEAPFLSAFEVLLDEVIPAARRNSPSLVVIDLCRVLRSSVVSVRSSDVKLTASRRLRIDYLYIA